MAQGGRSPFLRSFTGWKLAAAINILLTLALLITALALLSTTLSQPTTTTTTPTRPWPGWVFFTGECTTAFWANLWLRILLNVLGALFLASTNFFMQIVASPTRADIDSVHEKRRWLHIASPSIRNAFLVAPWKSAIWALLLLCALPFQMLVNTALFEVQDIDSAFEVTIAAEDFLHGGVWYPPGASLMTSGARHFLTPSCALTAADLSYGLQRDTSEYLNNGSSLVQGLYNVAANASANWVRLSRSDCAAAYSQCNGVRQYRNVVMVVTVDGIASGWARSQLYPLGETDTSFDTATNNDTANTLWFWGQCSVHLSSAGYPGRCDHTCAQAVGQQKSPIDPSASTTWDFSTAWRYSFFPACSALSGNQMVEVQYCLAEPKQDTCRVGLSGLPLAVLVACIGVKLLLSVVVLVTVGLLGGEVGNKRKALVTLGDVVASFIREPDTYTSDVAPMDRLKVRKWAASDFLTLQVCKWESKTYYGASAVTRQSWWLFVVAILLIQTFLIVVVGMTISFKGFEVSNFTPEAMGPIQTWVPGVAFGKYTLTAFVANSAQILISIGYLMYNWIITQFVTAKEWAEMSTSYRGLRVSDPKGDQRSTYYIQLPFKYTVPIIAISALAHWVLSMASYAFVGTGPFFDAVTLSIFRVDYPPEKDLLPSPSYISVGFSVPAVLAIFLITLTLTIVITLLSFRFLPGNIPIVGNNSAAIASSCRVSPASRVHLRKRETRYGEKLGSDRNSMSEKLLTEKRPVTPAAAQDDDMALQALAREIAIGLGGPSSGERPEGDAMSVSDLSSTTSSVRSSIESAAGGKGGVRLTEVFPEASTPSVRSSGDGGSSASEEGMDATVLASVSESKIKWGMVEMPEEFYQRFAVGRSMVGHLSFGVEEDCVKEPMDGHIYA